MSQKIDEKRYGQQFGPDQRLRIEGHLGNEKGQDCFSFRCINDSGKICQMVEDVNLQLGSEEWLIRHHLRINGNHIICDITKI